MLRFGAKPHYYTTTLLFLENNGDNGLDIIAYISICSYEILSVSVEVFCRQILYRKNDALF